MIVIFGKLTLADLELQLYCDGVQIDAQAIVDVQDYPDAIDVEVFARGNIQKKISLTVEFSHDDENEAELWVNTHNEDVLGKRDMLYVAGSFGGWQRFYKNAACLRCVSKAEGCRTFTMYEFVAGASSKNSPE